MEDWKRNRKFKYIDTFEDICMGMDVYCLFYPYSQKYDMEPIWGTVVSIGDTIDDVVVNQDGNEICLMHPGCHFFGMSKAYDYYIYGCM